MIVRGAGPDDVPDVARLHATRIAEGFLVHLGPRFLRRLYRRIERSPHSFLFVAEAEDTVVGFAAGATDLGALYRSFVVRDGVAAGLAAAPRLPGSVARILETLRYPAEVDDLPAAEILAVAVAADAGRRGIGRALVEESIAELGRRGVPAAKVVTTVDNAAALRMYQGAGFVSRRRITVHRGTDSEVLVWTSPSL